MVMQLLLGKVFHVTSAEAVGEISASGLIKSNQHGQLGYTFPQSMNSYGRMRGYVCFFDLRAVEDETVHDTLMKFYFPKPTSADPAFLFLAPSHHAELIPWTEAPTGAMVIPHVEAWYPTDVPVALLTHALALAVLPDDADSAYRGIIRSLQRDLGDILDSGRVLIEARTVGQLHERADEWVGVARAGGLEVDLDWDESRVEVTPNGYGIAVHAIRAEYWRGIRG